MNTITLTIPMIRAAARDAGNRYMREHPEEQPCGTAVWTHNAFNAASGEFNRLCRIAGISPYTLPQRAEAARSVERQQYRAERSESARIAQRTNTPYGMHSTAPIHDHLGRGVVSYDHGDEHDTYENHPEWLEDKPPYPFCRTPQLCAGKGYCPHDIACNN